MSRKREINALRMMLHILLVSGLSLLLHSAYSYICASKPYESSIIKITSEYSLTAWQVFSSLSTLTVALLSILQGRVDERYYGMSVKDVLYLPKSKIAFIPNYWEKIIIILILIVNVGVFLMHKYYVAALFAQLWSFVLLMQILNDSILIFTQSSRYQEIAKKYCDNLLLKLQENNKQEVKQIIANLRKEAEDRIKNDINPDDNIPLKYLSQHITRLYRTQQTENGESPNKLTSLESDLQVQLLLAVQKVYERSIDYQSVPYMRSLIGEAIYIYDSHIRRNYNGVTLHAYYQAKLPFECLQSLVLLYSNFSWTHQDLIDDLLLFVKIAIDNNDRALFGETIIKIYNNHIGYGLKKN